LDKFTKANAYAFLNNLANAVSFATEDDKALFLSEVKDNFEPQAGGGASKNPSYKDEVTGIMMHYCRFKQEFRPESEMNMFQGKSKGASKLAAKHDYELGKLVKELKDKALDAFKAGDFTAGADLGVKADELDATRKVASTFDDENLAYLVVVETTEDEASDEAVETNGEES